MINYKGRVTSFRSGCTNSQPMSAASVTILLRRLGTALSQSCALDIFRGQLDQTVFGFRAGHSLRVPSEFIGLHPQIGGM